MIKWVQKRDGRIVPFRAEKIADAIFAAAKAVGGEDRRQAEVLAGQVIHLLQQAVLAQEAPQVEDIQDLVEKVLIEQGHARTAKAFILYRNQRTRIREAKSELMDAVSEIFQEAGGDAQLFSTPLGKLQRIAIAASERYSLHNLLPRDFSQAHQRGRMHIDRVAHYTTAITAAVIDLYPLLENCQLVGRIQIPRLGEIDDLEQAIQALIVAAQSETIGEILLANVDQVFAALCQQNRLTPSQAEIEHFASRLLRNINLTQMTGSAEPLKVCLSIGLEMAPAGQSLVRALLQALQQGAHVQTSLLTPQIVFQLKDGVNCAASDAGYPLAQLAQQVAEQLGNPSFVYLASADATQVQFLASGTRLDMTAPILISRTYVNLPRLALEANNEREFLANIDAIFSLVAKQVVHRSEILTALQPPDLPLTASQLCEQHLLDAGRRVPLLKTALLLLVPVGIEEALQVVRHRFGPAFTVADSDFVSLLNEICEHWRNYYSLNLQTGLAPSVGVARRFFAHDASTFPLVGNLWPEGSAYSCLVSEAMMADFPGGQVAIWPESGQLRTGVVYTVPINRPVCLKCGHMLIANDCQVCQESEQGVVAQEDGYLVLREQPIAN